MNLYLFAGNILMAAVFLLKLNKLPPQIPLFYSKLWGEDQLVDLWVIAVIPILMNIFFLLNNYFVRRYFSEEYFIKRMIHYFNIFIIIGFTLIFIRIILLVA